MSDMNGNPHYSDAERYVNEASQINAWGSAERGIIAGNAQAQATLALAHEQRTANLIALWQSSDEHNPLNEFQWADVRNQITARMGIYPKGATK